MRVNRSNLGRKGSLGIVGALALALGGFGLLSGAVAADSSNTENVQRTPTEVQGEAIGDAALAGVADVFGQPMVHQVDVQVIAGDQETRENSSQTSTNEANVSQTDTAVAGDATADEGSTATSANATAGSFGLVHQMNIQVIAGVGCSVTQEASNVANLDQTATAASGAAEATGGGDAESGDASAMNRGVIQQRNIQVYVCKDGGTGSQVAENAGDITQNTAGMSGDASASEGGSSTTGDADARADDRLDQSNRQITID